MRPSLAVLVVAALVAPSARAMTETLTVPFTSVSNGTTGGVLTTQSYTGIVQITVSGTGWSASEYLNDAFWVYIPGAPYYEVTWYHLRIGTAHVVDQMGGTPPPYAANNVYAFTWNAGAAVGPLRFWVSDGNFSDNGGSYSITLVANDPPLTDLGGPYVTDETVPVTMSGAASSDPDGTIVGWTWDCEDDGLADAAAPTVACTYPDDGVYTARLTITDNAGASATGTTLVTVSNLNPAILSVQVPVDADEGTVLAFSATGADPSPADPLVATWSWGDGTPDNIGFASAHAFMDEGSYSVVVTVTDGDGGSASALRTVLVNNVDPTITSAPASSAVQDAPVSWPIIATDRGDDTLTFGLVSAPVGMSVDPSTGQIVWTPTYADVLAGPISFGVTVDDGDGGTTTQSWTISVLALDDDGDGIADGWETANGLDPTDPSDAGADSDGDGLSALDEFVLGTDPLAFSGPDAPLPLSPLDGVEVGTSPNLLVANATDPDGDPLVLTVELYADATLSNLVTTSPDWPQDPSGQTAWAVDVILPEATPHWWRARAADLYVTGPWSSVVGFTVNPVNDPPTAPAPATPLDGEEVPSLLPLLQWGASLDPDGDAVTYRVELASDPAFSSLIEGVDGLTDDGVLLEHTPSNPLVEDALVYLRARATDEHGLAGPFSIVVAFRPTTEDGAPFGLVWLAPEDGSTASTASPILSAAGAEDPEGSELTYVFEVAQDPSFATASSSGPRGTDGDGIARWDLDATGITLVEDAATYARARAGDGGVWSAWVAVTFRVDAQDASPSTPILLAPDDGSTVGSSPPRLVAAFAADPDGGALRYDFVLARDPALTDVLASAEALPGGNAATAGAGEMEWLVPQTLAPGTYFWSARALDGSDQASPWASAFSLVVAPGDERTGDDGGDPPPEPPDCACSQRGGPGGARLLLLAFLAPLWARRRPGRSG